MTHAPLDHSTRLNSLQPLPASTPQSQDQILGGQRRLEQQSLSRFSLDSSLAGLDASLSKIGEGLGLSDRPVPRSLKDSPTRGCRDSSMQRHSSKRCCWILSSICLTLETTVPRLLLTLYSCRLLPPGVRLSAVT